MEIAFHETRKWGDGNLTIGFDTDDGNWIVADFKAKGKRYGPVRLYHLHTWPESPEAGMMKYAVRGTFSSFDATQGGELYFKNFFGPEATDLAYSEHRRKVAAARKVIGRPEALNIAKDLLRAFYIENPLGSGKTPFDNYAMINQLMSMTYGNVPYEEGMKILEEAYDELSKE